MMPGENLTYSANFEEERMGPQAKVCRWHPEAGNSKETNSLLEFPEEMQLCQHFRL